MKLLKYSILILILLSIPSFTLAYISDSMGAILSYLSIALMMLYYFLVNDKSKLLLPFMLLGFSYFIISGLGYDGEDTSYYFVNFTKFIIVIICGAEVLKNTTLKELYIILIVGGLSIICHALFFSNIDFRFGALYGRYSGFYLNPNPAGVICLVGFSLSFGIKNTKLKLIGQLIFSFAGIITLSRYFISIWLLLNIISVIVSKKNLIVPMLSAVVLIFIIIFSPNSFKLNTDRFEALKSIFSSNEKLQTETITNNSRQETWAIYTDIILNKPFLGNGYNKIGRHNSLGSGVHNTYLLVIGEAGIFPFLILIWIIISLLLKGFNDYKSRLHYFLLAIVVGSFLLVSHTFFDVFFYVFIAIFLFIKLNETIQDNNEIIESNI